VGMACTATGNAAGSVVPPILVSHAKDMPRLHLVFLFVSAAVAALTCVFFRGKYVDVDVAGGVPASVPMSVPVLVPTPLYVFLCLSGDAMVPMMCRTGRQPHPARRPTAVTSIALSACNKPAD
jgi:hypothetical protein